MTDTAVCNSCEEEIEYQENDVMEREDMTYEGRWYRYGVVVCPKCGEVTEVWTH